MMDFDFFDEFFKWRKDFFERFFRNFGDINWPETDIIDKGEEIELRINLPGVKKEDIQLYATPNSISVSAETKMEKEEEKENFYRKERRMSSYARTISLPIEIDPDSIKAKYENGVLTLRAKKAKKGKRIAIE